jgi:hypothetical protein
MNRNIVKDVVAIVTNVDMTEYMIGSSAGTIASMIDLATVIIGGIAGFIVNLDGSTATCTIDDSIIIGAVSLDAGEFITSANKNRGASPLRARFFLSGINFRM